MTLDKTLKSHAPATSQKAGVVNPLLRSTSSIFFAVDGALASISVPCINACITRGSAWCDGTQKNSSELKCASLYWR